MNFIISETSYLESVGFDTSDWRKSIDGTKAIGHLEWIEILIPDALTNSNCQVYNADSAELENLLNSPEWKHEI